MCYLKTLTGSFVIEKYIFFPFRWVLQLLWQRRISFRFSTLYSPLEFFWWKIWQILFFFLWWLAFESILFWLGCDDWKMDDLFQRPLGPTSSNLNFPKNFLVKAEIQQLSTKKNLRSFDENWRHTRHICTRCLAAAPPPQVLGLRNVIAFCIMNQYWETEP